MDFHRKWLQSPWSHRLVICQPQWLAGASQGRTVSSAPHLYVLLGGRQIFREQVPIQSWNQFIFYQLLGHKEQFKLFTSLPLHPLAPWAGTWTQATCTHYLLSDFLALLSVLSHFFLDGQSAPPFSCKTLMMMNKKFPPPQRRRPKKGGKLVNNSRFRHDILEHSSSSFFMTV